VKSTTANPERGRWAAFVGWATLTLALPLFLVGCAGRGEAGSKKEPAGEEDVTPVVPVARVARADLVSDLTLTAEFEPFQEVDVMAKVAGYLHSITVDIGDRVREGQILATLEIPEMDDELARAAASVDQADAEITTASGEVERASSAHDLAHLSYTRILAVSKQEQGLVPQQEVDVAHSHDLVGEAQISAAKSNLQASQQKARVARAEQSRLKTMHGYRTIAAPFAGVVTKRFANIGSMIQAGTASQTQAMPVVRLSQNNLLRLILPVPESVVPRIHTGERVDVRVPSLGRTFPGRVARFAGKVLQSTRTMDTEVDVPNSDLTLVPGMYAEVDLRVAESKSVLTVPLDAVEHSAATARVFTVLPSGVVRVVPIGLGLETAQRVEVRSGLQEGDLVIVGRHAGLKDGQQVRGQLANSASERISGG